jgi:hypothetical protein
MEVGKEYVEGLFGGFTFFISGSGFQKVGSQWIYGGGGGISRAVIEELADGSVNLTVEAAGLNLSTKIHPSISLQLGDDFGSAAVGLKGTLQFP